MGVCRRFLQKSQKCLIIPQSGWAILYFEGLLMKKYGKFAALIVVVIGTLVWLATAEMKDNQTYYKTIAELGQMGPKAYNARIRVGGDVETGSIQRVGNQVRFASNSTPSLQIFPRETEETFNHFTNIIFIRRSGSITYRPHPQIPHDRHATS